MTPGAGAETGVPRRTSPLVRLTLYYGVLAAAVALLVTQVPALRQVFSFGQLEALSSAAESLSGGLGGGAAPGGVGSLGQAWVVLVAMIGALLLMVPVAWVYMLTKQRQGYDQSVVQTMIILPITVAGVMFVVRHSLALAFALAAIVAAVRFRNTLKDTKDTVYIFLAIGVGLAAGSQALVLAAVMSVVFNVVILGLWKFNVGNIYADQRALTPQLRLAEALFGPGKGAAPLAVGDPELLAALTPDELDEIADRAARLQAYVAARAGDKKKRRFNGLVLVHAAQAEPAQRVAEAVLEDQVQRWKLAEILPAEGGGGGGHSTLEYLVRLKEESLAATVLDTLRARGAPHIVAVEFKSLKGLSKKAS